VFEFTQWTRSRQFQYARIAQLVEAPDLGSGGWGFESLCGYFFGGVSVAAERTCLTHRQSSQVRILPPLPYFLCTNHLQASTHSLNVFQKEYMSKVIKDNVDLHNLFLKKIPDIFQYVEVRGWFNCERNQLTSLQGVPMRVNDNFFCRYNELTSLVGAPEYVGGSFVCHSNQLTSLEGAPEYVGGSFDCGINQLTSLVGAPKLVGSYFACVGNQLSSLVGAPEHIGGTLFCSANPLQSLEGVPKRVDGDFYCFGNIVKFTEEQVRAVCNVKGKVYV
jgi:hypothetical protein